jgi:hypothetical protein
VSLASIDLQRIASEAALGRDATAQIAALTTKNREELKKAGAPDPRRLQAASQNEIAALQSRLQLEFQTALQPILESVSRSRSAQIVFSVADSGMLWVRPDLDLTTASIAALDASTKDELSVWYSARDSGNATAIRDYLRRYPNGRFREPADARLRELSAQSQEPSPPVRGPQERKPVRQVQTDQNGRFSAFLNPGVYRVIVDLVGFASTEYHGVRVSSSNGATLEVTLRVSGIAETVIMTGRNRSGPAGVITGVVKDPSGAVLPGVHISIYRE